jgi:hypothetical protein
VKERHRVSRDKRRVKTKGKFIVRSERHFTSGAGKREHLIVRRFPGNIQSSF